MHPRQQIDPATDRPQRAVIAAVGPGAGKNLVAHDARFQGLPRHGKGVGRNGPVGLRIGNQLGDGLLLDGRDGFGPRQLALGLFRRAKRVVVFRLQRLEDGVGRRDLVLLLHRARLSRQLLLHLANLADVAVGRHDGFGHAVLGHLAGETLDHQDRVLVARDDQVEIALLESVVRGEGYELALDQAQPYRADGALEGQGRNLQRGRGPVHPQDVAVVLPVAGHHERLYLHFIAEPLGKQRPDGTVHQPRGERFLGRRPAFALQKAAGELARRSHALAVVAGEGEEIARPRRAGGGRHQHYRFAILHKTTAGRLLCQFAGLKR